MVFAPDVELFTRRYEAGERQIVHTKYVADLETPVSVMLKLTGGKAPSFLLESVEGGDSRGRYSIIGLDPDMLWRCQDGVAAINHAPGAKPDDFTPVPGAALDSLRTAFREAQIDHHEGLPPTIAGLVGYLGYDMVRLVERLPQPNPDPLGLPDALLMRPQLIGVLDAVRDELTLATPVRPQSGVSAKVAYARALQRLEAACEAMDQPLPPTANTLPATATAVAPQSNVAQPDYEAMVKKAQDYILAGDIFQVVLSQRFAAPFPLPATDLYRALRRINPSPFLFLLNFDGFQVAGSSPEILVRLRDGEVTIRPIAGTRPRGATAAEDRALAENLLADPKERAEHLMLLDLGRNDVGRVAVPGSVKVTASYMIEHYSHVMHIVSNVTGQLDPAHDAIDALFAGFPAGTVSGAPKIRAMEIIDELEPEKRGIYAGAVGYFGIDGSLDSCIVLRTAVLKDGVLYGQSGAGIVADSVPLSEHRECEAKARAVFSAGAEAIARASAAERGQ